RTPRAAARGRTPRSGAPLGSRALRSRNGSRARGRARAARRDRCRGFRSRPCEQSTAVDLCRASAHARAPMAGGRNADDLYGLRVGEIKGAPRDVPPCPVCRATTAHPRFAVEKLDAPVVVCEGCGTGRFEPMLDSASIASLYPDDYYGGPGSKFQPLVERAVRWIGARHVSFLALGLEPGSRVLDV